MAKVLVLCPTFDHADTLFASIASVRAQRFQDWEMAVIGDGAPQRTRQIVDAIRAEDARIQLYLHPKSARFGEIYRDPVIRDSQSEFICHLSDDDIWAPDHLDQMLGLLRDAEWANQAPLRIDPAGGIEWWPVNHGTAAMRAGCRTRAPLSAGLNYVAYRRQAYLRLPEGWTCAPWEAGTSDVYMWSKFFHLPDLVVASSAVTSAFKFPSTASGRRPRTPEQRMAEITPWLARAAEPGLADRMRQAGSIRTRMVKLFALHGAGHCDSLASAFALSGLQPVAANMAPEPAINGAPMRLPLTEVQYREALTAWALVRSGDASGVEDVRLPCALSEGFDDGLLGCRESIRSLAQFAGPDAALRALGVMSRIFPEAGLGALKHELQGKVSGTVVGQI